VSPRSVPADLHGWLSESKLSIRSPGPRVIADRARTFSPETVADMRCATRVSGASGAGSTPSCKPRPGWQWSCGDRMEPRLMPVSAIDDISGHLMASGAMVVLAHRVREGGSWLALDAGAEAVLGVLTRVITPSESTNVDADDEGRRRAHAHA